VNVLVTSSRMPAALDEIRKLGKSGHTVFAADSFLAAPGGYSRFARARFQVSPPEQSPLRFVADVAQIVRLHHIDLLVPSFEEVFYLARHHEELSEQVRLFASPLALLRRLHDKSSFRALAGQLGIPTPEGVTVESELELRAALRRFPRYLARPTFSRGGLEVLANGGALAGRMSLGDCHPTPARPWLVQAFVDGPEVCTFAVAHHGRVTLHCTYRHPLEIEHRGGIVFESIEDGEAEAQVRRLVEATGYHGQIGLDFRRDARGLHAVDCNTRPTAGVHLTRTDELVGALLSPRGSWVVPPGRRRKYASAVMRDLLLHWRHAPRDAAFLVGDARDVYGEAGDRLPALIQVLSYAHVLAFRARHHIAARGTGLMAAYFDGIQWNGSEIP
jgi:predicted ATP-grasp superfamily ATP-dependent carboligase